MKAVRLVAALLVSLPIVCSLQVAAQQAAAGRSVALLAVLSHDRAVRQALGSTFDVVRTQPVPDQTEQFVVDVATRARSSGLRALVDLRSLSIIRMKQLAPADIMFDQSDVAEAFALVKNLASVRARLGSTLSLYRVGALARGASSYRVEGLPVRGSLPRDPCATHRCLELLFHSPRGYVAGLPVLVDLTAGHRIEGPAEEPGPHRIQKIGQQPTAELSPTASTGLTSPECSPVKFFTATSSWIVCWTYVTGFGLVLGPVSFKRSGGSSSFGVIAQASVAQIFVPYASGFPRFFDTSFGFPNAGIAPGLCLKGALLDGGVACLEHRDRDIDWLFPGGAVPTGRRGEEVVLWSVLYAANYLYIEEWGFRDDGVLWGRVGATGQNLPGLETESHTHDYVWRIVPHIAGRGNSVNYVAVNEPVSGLTATDVDVAVTHPTPVVWSPQRFDQLEVYAPGVTNGRGDTTSYRLIPMPVAGLAHHNEAFTQADLWATKGDPLETDAASLPTYAAEKVSLVNTSVAFWYRGSFHHQPRDEDGYYDSSGNFIGTTHAFWVGFVLYPRNLFDSSPFF